jgi:hypothetical protein
MRKFWKLKLAILIHLTFIAAAHADGGVYLGNLKQFATGTDLGGGHRGLDISGSITASSTSTAATGIAVPADATYVGGNKSGNLTGLLIGQQTMANSLACVLPSDQSAIPVTGTFWQATQPVSIAATVNVGQATGTNLHTVVDSGSVTVSQATGTNLHSVIDSGSVTATISGTPTVTANQGGTWTVQPGNTANTTAWLVTGTGGTFPATQSGTWNINNISGTVSLPTGAATAAKQPALGTAGSASTDVITVQGIASMTALKVDGSAVTQPVSGTVTANQGGTWNINNISGTVSLPTGAATAANQTTANTSLSTIATNSAKQPINTTGSGSAAAATVSTVITLSAPANAVGFVLQNLDTSTANIRWAVGRAASATLGQQLQPGRDTGFIPVGANVSLVAESGTQNYDIQWVSQ